MTRTLVGLKAHVLNVAKFIVDYEVVCDINMLLSQMDIVCWVLFSADEFTF